MDNWLRTVRDSSYVDRFHNTVVHRPYNVGFHTYNVLTICHYLIQMNNIPRSEAFDLIICCMYHDAHEVYTGDIPANFKWENTLINKQLKQSERRWEDDNLPEDFKLSRDRVSKNPNHRTLYKQADLLELGFFVRDEMDLGNKRIKEKLIIILNSSMKIQEDTELKGVYEIINYLGGKDYE